jgi:hypothetical protein
MTSFNFDLEDVTRLGARLMHRYKLTCENDVGQITYVILPMMPDAEAMPSVTPAVRNFSLQCWY